MLDIFTLREGMLTVTFYLPLSSFGTLLGPIGGDLQSAPSSRAHCRG